MYSAKPRLNKTVLRRRLKDVVDRWSLMSVGRLFHYLSHFLVTSRFNSVQKLASGQQEYEHIHARIVCIVSYIQRVSAMHKLRMRAARQQLSNEHWAIHITESLVSSPPRAVRPSVPPSRSWQLGRAAGSQRCSAASSNRRRRNRRESGRRGRSVSVRRVSPVCTVRQTDRQTRPVIARAVVAVAAAGQLDSRGRLAQSQPVWAAISGFHSADL